VLESAAKSLEYIPLSSLSARKIMKLIYTKDIPQSLGKIKIFNDTPMPSSFVDYKLVEALFLNARRFLTKVFRNVESQVETARLLGEVPIIPDDEMFRLMWKYCKDKWGISSIRQLSAPQKIDLAKHMKYNYSSANSQISRVTTLSRKDIDTLFPLSAK